jgi:hypothetical protein
VGSPARGAARPDRSKAENSGTENSGTDAIRDLLVDLRELLQQELRTAQDELAGKAHVASEGSCCSVSQWCSAP